MLHRRGKPGKRGHGAQEGVPFFTKRLKWGGVIQREDVGGEDTGRGLQVRPLYVGRNRSVLRTGKLREGKKGTTLVDKKTRRGQGAASRKTKAFGRT